MLKRCAWVPEDPLYRDYHDQEWGNPVHDDNRLFEFLVLEGSQAGLSWATILRKRENYRIAFNHFDPQLVARYDQSKIQELLTNPGIVRNKRKIEAAIQNARAFLEIQRQFGSFDAYIWQFTGGKTKINAWREITEIPAQTLESHFMSQDLRKRGFRFVGATICYAFMQAIGMVNDHTMDCFRYEQLLNAT
jgi:DNA-3-methyladenine glycosylase I